MQCTKCRLTYLCTWVYRVRMCFWCAFRDSRNRLEISRRGRGTGEYIQMFYFLRFYSYFGSAFISLPPSSLSLHRSRWACVCECAEWAHLCRNERDRKRRSSSRSVRALTHACSAMYFMTFHLKPEQASRAGRMRSGKGWKKITEKFSLRA